MSDSDVGPTGRPNKPQLYQASANKEMNSDTTVWAAMGVYDDEDLVQDGCFLLVCPHAPDFIWVGPEYSDEGCADLFTRVHEGFQLHDGLEGDTLAGMLEWAAKVEQGQVPTDGITGMALQTNEVLVLTQGSEPEGFWDVFSEGF